MNKLAILSIAFLLYSCGGSVSLPDKSCQEMYGPEFCNSITGPQGGQGEAGEQGTVGEAGVAGEDGSNGQPGPSGEGCTVTQLDEGALVICGEDTSAMIWNGTDGKDGTDSIIEVIGLCNHEKEFGEVLYRLSDDRLYGVYSSGTKIHLVMIIPGSYVTTDGFNCYFKVTDNNEVLF